MPLLLESKVSVGRTQTKGRDGEQPLFCNLFNKLKRLRQKSSYFTYIVIIDKDIVTTHLIYL